METPYQQTIIENKRAMMALVRSPKLYNVLQCKTHQDNYSECNLNSVNKIFLHLALWSLFFYLIWPIFQHGLDIIKQHSDKVSTCWSLNNLFLHWPSFWSNMTLIRTWPRYNSDKHSDKISSCWSKKCGIERVNKISLQFGLVT